MKNKRTKRIRRIIETIVSVTAAFIAVGWSDVSTTDRMTDKKISAYAVAARQSISFAGKKISAHLVVGCMFEDLDGKDRLGSYVIFSEQIAAFSQGKFRFDEGEVKEFRSAGGAQGGETINVSPFYDYDFSKIIAASSRFRLEVQLATGREFLEFNTKGAREMIAKLPCKPR